MVGLTEIGLKARIINKTLTVTEPEALDLFFMYPTLVSIEWKNKEIFKIKVNGLNLEFTIRD